MNKVHKILFSPITDLDRKIFVETFSDLNFEEKKYLLEKILSDKISPIFYNYLKNNNLDHLFVDEFRNKINNQVKRFQIQNFEVVREVVYLNKLFRKNSLNPIFIKGVAIINNYDDISLRPMVDIDIFFQKDEIFKAYSLLKKNEFKELRFKSLSSKSLLRFSNYMHQLPELVGKSNISVELHHRLTIRKDFEYCPLVKKINSSKKSIDFFGEEIFVPKTDFILLHQLIHFSLNSNFENQLRIFSDIKQIEKNNIIDWDKIINNFEEVKIKKALCLSLGILNFDFNLSNNYKNFKKNNIRYFPKRNKVIHKKIQSLKIKNERNFINNILHKLNVLVSTFKSRSFLKFLSLLIDWVMFKFDTKINFRK